MVVGCDGKQGHFISITHQSPMTRRHEGQDASQQRVSFCRGKRCNAERRRRAARSIRTRGTGQPIMAGNPQGSKTVQRDENRRSSHAPQPAQQHLNVEEEERAGRPPHSAPRTGERTDVPVTSHDDKDAKGVTSPQQKAGR
jgi:hypothetical protein